MYMDHEDYVREFFEHSLNGTMDQFDFEAAFDDFRPEIDSKLILHGLCDFDVFLSHFEDLYWAGNELDRFCLQTGYINIDSDDILHAIAKLHYEKSNEAFGGLGSFEELQEIIEAIEDADFDDTPAMVALFDRIIHAQHETGDIYDFDPDDIRADIEAEFEESKKTELMRSRLAKFR